MSRDVYLYEIRTRKIKEKIVIYDAFETRYLFYSEDQLPPSLTKYAQKVMVRYEHCDYGKACMEHFGSKWTSSKFRGGSDCETFFNGETELGTLTFDELAKYDYVEDKLTYVVPIRLLACPDNSYPLSFRDGVYSATEILEEMIRLIRTERCRYSPELIEALALAYERTKEGKKIFFRG